MSDSEKLVHLKKYANRRLYDTEKSVYVTLAEVSEMIKQGRWVAVTDVDSGEDVTAFILTQIVMEAAKKKNALLPVPLLHLIIRYGETILVDFFGKHLEKMVRSYLTYKEVVDEQFNQWLEMGAGLTAKGSRPFDPANPLQSFFKQFFPSESDISDDKGQESESSSKDAE
ncbi:MAG: transcriptional regulator [Desulfobacteraceae bacterium]|nr:MAG: transcriptional regulator [Desulfobacteraceae bacterium]